MLDWYDRNGRDLPWRRTRDRWAILVSEIMLQQTQVVRVEPVFRRFLAAYPTPSSLAKASAADVVQAWGDLGYLRRARHLHAASRQIAASGWPDDLTEMPGVGRYTAAALRAFADGVPVAAVDVNLRRTLSRWAGQLLSLREAEDVGNDAVDGDRPADWNQAMMDLGARLCRPRRPRCEECPVSQWCRDPSVEIAAARQGAFVGSVRQARAAVVKQLARSDDSVAGVVAAVGLDPGTIAAAVEALIAEGVVCQEAGTLRLC